MIPEDGLEALEDHSGSSQLAALRFVKACMCNGCDIHWECLIKAGEPPAFMRLERDEASLVKLVILMQSFTLYAESKLQNNQKILEKVIVVRECESLPVKL